MCNSDWTFKRNEPNSGMPIHALLKFILYYYISRYGVYIYMYAYAMLFACFSIGSNGHAELLEGKCFIQQHM